jgi:hypothetical protein
LFRDDLPEVIRCWKHRRNGQIGSHVVARANTSVRRLPARQSLVRSCDRNDPLPESLRPRGQRITIAAFPSSRVGA